MPTAASCVRAYVHEDARYQTRHSECMDDTSSSLEASVANLSAPVLRTNAAHDHPGILPSIVQFANARTAFRVILHLRWHYDSALRGSEELIELSGVGSCMSSSDY